MTVSVHGTARVESPQVRRSRGVGAVYRVEMAKISSQLLPRLVALACLVAPLGFTLFIDTQSGVPADSLFGRWVHTSGFAIPFVTLQFAATAGFPLIAGVVAGDIFAGEDRQGTWKTILTRSCSRRGVFWGKTCAALTYSAAMVLVIAASSLISGVLIVGDQSVIGLSGAPIDAGRATALVAESFAIALVPTLAFTCVAIFFSVASRNSIVGIGAPFVIWLVMVLVSLMGSGVVVRSMLATNYVEAWHGLQIPHSTTAPIWLGLVVSAAYAVLSLNAARRLFRGRDFAGDGQLPLSSSGLRRGAVVAAVITAVIVAGMILDRTWITSKHVEASVAATFKNLVVDQQALLGRKIHPAAVQVYPYCNRESVLHGPSTGAGDDWACTLYVNGPHVSQGAVRYTLTIRPNGCYTAESAPEIVGPLHMKTAGGGTAINPLLAFDGCMVAP